MVLNSQEGSLNMGLPIASISDRRRLLFLTSEDLDRAWDLGIFYLKVPNNIDLDGARRFGRGLIAADSPYRQIPKYGELEGIYSPRKQSANQAGSQPSTLGPALSLRNR